MKRFTLLPLLSLMLVCSCCVPETVDSAEHLGVGFIHHNAQKSGLATAPHPGYVTRGEFEAALGQLHAQKTERLPPVVPAPAASVPAPTTPVADESFVKRIVNTALGVAANQAPGVSTVQRIKTVAEVPGEVRDLKTIAEHNRLLAIGLAALFVFAFFTGNGKLMSVYKKVKSAQLEKFNVEQSGKGVEDYLNRNGLVITPAPASTPTTTS
jgi:hypothetical protein